MGFKSLTKNCHKCLFPAVAETLDPGNIFSSTLKFDQKGLSLSLF